MTDRPKELKRLTQDARNVANDPRFFAGLVTPDFSVFQQDFGRVVYLQAATDVIEKAMSDFKPRESDAWLAPRLYASLRLTPKEASDTGVWLYLALVAYPDYVRWRWTNNRNFNRDNFLGSLNQQALSRLWWSAELLRNGGDYSVVKDAHTLQDISSTILSLNLAHNRGAAIAITRYALDAYRDKRMTTKQMNTVLSKKFRAAAMTRSLDELSPAPELIDPSSLESWISEIPDSRDLIRTDDIPAPDGDAIPDSAIENVYTLLKEIAPFEQS